MLRRPNALLGVVPRAGRTLGVPTGISPGRETRAGPARSWLAQLAGYVPASDFDALKEQRDSLQLKLDTFVQERDTFVPASQFDAVKEQRDSLKLKLDTFEQERDTFVPASEFDEVKEQRDSLKLKLGTFEEQRDSLKLKLGTFEQELGTFKQNVARQEKEAVSDWSVTLTLLTAIITSSPLEHLPSIERVFIASGTAAAFWAVFALQATEFVQPYLPRTPMSAVLKELGLRGITMVSMSGCFPLLSLIAYVVVAGALWVNGFTTLIAQISMF